jgi:alginate O-acetyltransferase complex protein AlgI
LSFASPAFLWYFLPLVLGLYLVLPRTWRNGLLSVASLVFYAWGGGAFVLLLLACMAVNFTAGILVDTGRSEIESEQEHGRPRIASVPARRAVLVATVAFDLGILAVWKYGDFATRQLHALTGSFRVLSVALPIGISFFTFHHLSYVVDVYRGSRRSQRSPVQFITYIAMFPQLIAGPIVRYHEIAEQLSDTKRNRLEDISEGFPRFALGLAKKVVIADAIAPVADAAFNGNPAALDFRTAWIGAIAYTLQIYFDFSGYSDMAIGLGRMFGFRLPENFNRPYSSVSVTDFWRRWHMSLSRWFRDYLYIPLGGNRGSTAMTYRNLYIVFLLTGFWHGANWTFLIWGLYHGSWLAAERALGIARADPNRLVVLRRALTLLIVVVGWVFFRSSDLGRAGRYLATMAVPQLSSHSEVLDGVLSTRITLLLALAALVALLPRSFVMGRLLERASPPARVARLAYAGVAAPYAAVLVAAGTFSPFLYFQF